MHGFKHMYLPPKIILILSTISFIERQKYTLKKFGPETWCTKEPFGYRVAHQNSLTSCLGQV